MHPARASRFLDAPRHMGASASSEKDEERNDYRVRDREYERRDTPPTRPDSSNIRPLSRYDRYRADDTHWSPPNVRHAFRREESDAEYRPRERRDDYDYRRNDRWDHYEPFSDERTSPPARRPRYDERESSPSRRSVPGFATARDARTNSRSAKRSYSPLRHPAYASSERRNAPLTKPTTFRNLSWTKPISPPNIKRTIGQETGQKRPPRFETQQALPLDGTPSAPKAVRELFPLVDLVANEKPAGDDFTFRGAADGNQTPMNLDPAEDHGFAIRGAAVSATKPVVVRVGPYSPVPRPSKTAASSMLQSRFRRDTEDSGSVTSGRTASDSSGSKLPKCHVCKERSGSLLECTTCSRHYDRRCLPSLQRFGDDWQCPRCRRKGIPAKRRASEMLSSAEQNLPVEEESPAKRLRLEKEVDLQLNPQSEAATDPLSVVTASEKPAAILDPDMDDAHNPVALSDQNEVKTPPAPQDLTRVVQARGQAAWQEQTDINDMEIGSDLDEAMNLVDESFNVPESTSANLKKVKKLSQVVRKVTRPAVDALFSPSRDKPLPETTHAEVTGATSVSMAHDRSNALETEHDHCGKTIEGRASFAPTSKHGTAAEDAATPNEDTVPRSSPTGLSRPFTTDAAKPDLIVDHLRDLVGSASPVDSVMQQADSTRVYAKKSKSRTEISKSKSKCTACDEAYVPWNPWNITECPSCSKKKAAAEAVEWTSPGAEQPRPNDVDDEEPSRASSLARSTASAVPLTSVDGYTAPSLDEKHAKMVQLGSSTSAACEDCRRRKQHCVHRAGASSVACEDCRRAHIRCDHQVERIPRDRRPLKKGQAVKVSHQIDQDAASSISDGDFESVEARNLSEASTHDHNKRNRRIPQSMRQPASPDRSATTAGSEVSSLGNSFKRANGVYRRLVCMAMCDTPSRRLTARSAAEWIAENIPNYDLRKSNWAAGLKAFMYGQDKVKGDTKYLERVEWQPSFGGDPDTLWFALIPGMELEVEHWDAALGQPVSPPKTLLSPMANDGLPSEENGGQSFTPSKSKNAGQATKNQDQTMLLEEADSEKEEDAEEISSRSDPSSYDEDAMDVEEKTSESSDDEPLSAIHKRSIQATSANAFVLQDRTSKPHDTATQGADAMEIGIATPIITQHAPTAQMAVPAIAERASQASPTAMMNAASTTANQDAPLDEDLWNFIRDLPPPPSNPSLSLSESYPEHFFDRRAKLAEIKARPSRKQQINNRIANLYGKGGGVVDTTVQRQRNEQRPHRVLETDTGVTELKNDVSTLQNCSTLEEFLGTEERLVADVVDKQLVYRKNDGKRTRTVYKTGL